MSKDMSGPTLPVASKPSFSKPSGSKLQTTHLRLVPGEAEVFSASDKDGCWWLQNEDNMVISNQRVLFLRRQWVWGLCFASHEEAYYLDDLQFVTLIRVTSFIWLAFALVGIILGAALLAAADLAKPAPRSSYYGSSDLYSMATTTYGVLLAFGIILLLGGIGCLVVFIVKHLRRGMYLHLNFSRKDVGITDWYTFSWWKPRMSSTRRIIKLPKATAQEGYNALAAMLHDKFSLRIKPNRAARDSAGSID